MLKTYKNHLPSMIYKSKCQSKVSNLESFNDSVANVLLFTREFSI